MSYQSIPLLAGVPHRLDIAGRLILIDSVGESDGVDVEILLAGSSKTNTVPRRKPGFRLVQAYDGVILTSAVEATVGIFLSNEDVQLGVADGSAVSVPGGVRITNPEPIPVLFGGTVAPVLGIVKVDNTNAEAIPVLQKAGESFDVRPEAGATFPVSLSGESAVRPYLAAAIANVAPVAVTAVAGALVALVATRRSLRLRNVGASAVAIGGAGLTFANAAIIIQPGEVWLEGDAPGAAWYGICDAGLSSTLNIQSVT